MKIERRRKLAAREWAAITSSRPVVRRVLERPEARRPESSISPGPSFLGRTSLDEMSTQKRVRGD